MLNKIIYWLKRQGFVFPPFAEKVLYAPVSGIDNYMHADRARTALLAEHAIAVYNQAQNDARIVTLKKGYKDAAVHLEEIRSFMRIFIPIMQKHYEQGSHEQLFNNWQTFCILTALMEYKDVAYTTPFIKEGI